MKLLTKKNVTVAGLGALCALTLSVGAGMLATASPATAESNVVAPDAATYFYDGLKDDKGNEYTLAKNFYKALDEMNKSGDFKDGVVEYNLSSILTSDEIKGWVIDGDLTIPKAFSAARDAYITDHPELFYVNLYKATISAGRNNGVYSAYIDSGREANLYYTNGLNSLASVNDAIAKYNERIDEIVAEMNRLEENENAYSARDAFLAKEVNKYLAENITYDYVAYDNKDDPNYIAAAYINTAYGGLVQGKAVCGGYSTSYKAIMDKLGIPCITVNGYTKNRDQNGKNAASNVYHMWNYVWLEAPSQANQKLRAANGGAWYSMDVTWDYSALNKYRYAVMNSSSDAEIHVNDGVISSSGYRLEYPELSLFYYGSTGENDGLVYSISYNRDEENIKDDTGEPLQCNYKTVSYNGKSALRLLEEDGLHIAYRDAVYDGADFKKEIQWSRWTSLATFINETTGGIHDEEFYIKDHGTETQFYNNTSIYATQFAVFDVEPDGFYWQDNPNYAFLAYYYSDDLVSQIDPIEKGELLINQTYGTYTPPPYILAGNQEVLIMSDSMRDNKITDKVVCAEDKAFVFEISYDEPLHVLDPTKPIGISFASDHPNTKDYAKFFPLSKDGDGNDVYVELVEGYENSGSTKKILNTLRFKFGPSLMYEHNEENYHFTFSNVGSAKVVQRLVDGELKTVTSDKAPNPAYYTFGRSVIACPARFNYDGRLWIECCAQPTLVTQTDLSAMNFEDENGNSTFSENERSQMMLVAEKASEETVDAILDGIGDIEGSNVTKKDIHTSETYDITLQMCNKYPKISDGSYVKIALGFPEGYGPENKGVTFKLYHRKHIEGDEYIIEEVPCVVTQFGIVATVTSFSPYMVAVVDADKATDKTVYASIEGNGGKLTKEDGQIKSVKEGESCKYTIKPDDGYIIYSVTLNHKEIKDRVASNGELTLTYDELSGNNELEIKYIAIEAAHRYLEKSIEEPVKAIVSADGNSVNVIEGTGGIKELVIPVSSNQLVGMIIGIVIIAAVFCAAVTAIVIVVRRKQK